MSFSSKLRLWYLMILLTLVLLSACGPQKFCDCGWGGTVTTWFDANGNSIWDADEQPLAGVKIDSNYTDVETTDPNGKAKFDIWSPGCSCNKDYDLRFHATAPMGYRLTTFNDLDTLHGDVKFGFELDPLSTTKTPNPIALKCTSYNGDPNFGDPTVSDLEIDNQGHIWSSTLAGWANEFIPAQGIWHHFLQNPLTYSLAQSQSGSIWIGGSEDVAIWDGTHMKNLPSKCQSQIAFVEDIAFSKDGTAWLGTYDGALKIDSNTNDCTLITCSAWKENPLRDGIGQNTLEKVAAASDGSVWVLNFYDQLSRIDNLGDSFDSGDCLTFSPAYVESSKQHLQFKPTVLVPGKEGGLWLAGGNSIAYLDTLTNQLTYYDPILQPSDLNFVSLDIYPDGSLLIGTYGQGLLRYWPEKNGSPVSAPMLFNTTDGITNNNIQAIKVDADGSIWVGTRNGLSHCFFQNP